jgi:hypothetical protein
MAGGSSSKQESSNKTVTTTNTSTVQGIEEGGMVAGGNITTIDAGTVDLARLAVESSLAGLIEGQGQAINAIEDNARGAAQLVGGSITAMAKGQEEALNFGRYAFDSFESTQSEVLAFANETIAESLASYGSTALNISKATSSDTTQVLNNALKYGGIGIATLAVVFAISGVIKR